ncbi:hypothetical protein [Gimesia chilikensis]|uniref:hypothetical protein n=1 Tax=Gimesia chilikensis TaxID=2605989 RepID=UPI0016597A85|nr:hypothetical protein [Gimesia chilikensis]
MNLERLSLNGTQVTGSGLEHLKDLMDLEYLSLENTEVDDTGLLHLNDLSNLRTLYIRNTRGTEAGIAELKMALPDCVIVDDSYREGDLGSNPFFCFKNHELHEETITCTLDTNILQV